MPKRLLGLLHTSFDGTQQVREDATAEIVGLHASGRACFDADGLRELR